MTTTINVSNSAQLTAAIAAARGGERIVLAAGDYSSLVIRDRNFTTPITITSSESLGAKLAGVTVFNSSNVNFTDVSLGRALQTGERDWTQLNWIQSSNNVTFDRVFIHGSLDNNPGNDGWGMFVANSNNVTVQNSRLQELNRGVLFDNSSNVKAVNNTFFSFRSDGLNFTATDNVLVQGNHFSNFRPAPGDHPDAIQFWTNGQTRGSTNIVIRDNVVLQGEGVGIQGIFIRDERGNIPHQNILIENNLLYGADQFHGIHIDGGVNVQIRNNTVVSPTTDTKRFWIMVMNVDGVVIEKNVTDQVVVGERARNVNSNDNWVLHQNATLTGLVPNLNGGAGTRIEDLIVAQAYGFKPLVQAPAPAPAPVPTPTPSPAPAPSPTPTPTPSQDTGNNVGTKLANALHRFIVKNKPAALDQTALKFEDAAPLASDPPANSGKEVLLKSAEVVKLPALADVFAAPTAHGSLDPGGHHFGGDAQVQSFAAPSRFVMHAYESFVAMA
jgi:hypothetical protein